ncbi:hypothetical protein COLO4_18399 [Corchorus olitorius]|uniref:Uncharacterized protein n=1 Tax=Corchorus olitorius TaxID=93759 RepID=A0A1R3J986_9ROSI|nr:hypothetical protein COLO4_18399 [Corchorus olitorius]
MGDVAKKERGASRSRLFPLAEGWIHAVPVIVLLSFFFLWWMSHPVHVEIKDGKIVAIHEVEMPLPLNHSEIEMTILASSATSPIASVPQNLTGNGTETNLVSKSN